MLDMQLNLYLSQMGLSLRETVADGHCLLYAVVDSWNSQFTELPYLNLQHLKTALLEHVFSMPYLYAPFVIPPTKENVVHGTIMYISNKHYDQPVGDIIPMMLANCLKTNFCILNVMQERKFEFKNVNTLSHTNRTLTILRSGDHYKTVIKMSLAYPTDLNKTQSPPQSIPVQISKESMTRCAANPPGGVNYSNLKNIGDGGSVVNYFNLAQPHFLTTSDSSQKILGIDQSLDSDLQSNYQGSSYCSNAYSDLQSVLSNSAHSSDLESMGYEESTLTSLSSISDSTNVSGTESDSLEFDHQSIPLTDKELHILYTNIDTYLNKREELHFRLQQEQPDILCLTEILPKARVHFNACEYQIPNYTFFTNTDHKRGVAIYVKSHLQASTHQFTESSFEEAVWCVINLEGQDKLLVGAIYRSPNSTPSNNKKLISLLHQVQDKNFRHILIMGDFNYKNINWNTFQSDLGPNSATSTFSASLQCLGLFQHVKQPTRYRNNQNPSILDLIITNEEGTVFNLEYKSPIAKSDHIVMTFKFNRCVQSSPQKSKYRYYKGDYQSLRKHMQSINWDIMRNQDIDVQAKWNHLYNEIIHVTQLYIPKSLPQDTKRPAWMNHNVQKKLNAKHNAWNTYQKNRTCSNWHKYKQKRRTATKAVKTEKRCFERKIAQKIKTNSKSFWNLVRSQCKLRSDITDLIKTDGSRVADDLGKANCLNTFFSSVFTNEDTNSLPILAPRIKNHQLSDVSITQEKVYKHLSKLKTNKSPGPDTIHNKVLYEARGQLARPLSHLFKSSLASGEIPQIWKHAHVTPIHKKSDKTDPNNYRPVSLTSSVGKILESIIRDDLQSYLENNNLLCKEQFGFRSGKSCSTQLLQVVNEWSKAIDMGKPVDVIYLDYQKAFDSVPHQRLLIKLKAYGITGTLLTWITNFLTGRSQKVVVNGILSTPTPVLSGIPQGSVLGPLLFLIYVNDLPSDICSSLMLFADDTKIYRCIQSTEDAETLQADLNTLSQWSTTWQLPFNVDKCKVLHFGQKNLSHQYTMYSLGKDKPITAVEEEKDLGILFDKKLRFSNHIKSCISKANQRIGIIRRNFKFLNQNSFLTIYNSMVRPILEYASSVWYTMYKQDSEAIEKVQRRATKLLLHLRKLPYPERLRRLNLPSLVYRRRIADLIQVYRIIHQIDIINSQEFFSFTKDNVTRGHSLKLSKDRAKSKLGQRVFSSRVVHDWNSLKENTVTSVSLDQFKNRLEKDWKDKEFKFNPTLYHT